MSADLRLSTLSQVDEPRRRGTVRHASACLLLVVAVALASGSYAQDTQLLPVPEAEELQDARSTVLEFLGKYAKKHSKSKSAGLAKEACEYATSSNSDDSDAVRYALFLYGIDFAVDAESPDLVVEVIERLASQFAVPRNALIVDHVQRALSASSNRSTKIQQAGFEHLVRACGVALDDGDLTTVKRALVESERLGKKLKHYPVAKQLQLILKTVPQFESEPGIRVTHFELGVLYCLVDDWSSGIHHLTQGSDEQIASIARRDKKDPDEAEYVSLGDAWWEAAQHDSGARGKCWKERAVFWYRIALPKMTKKSVTRVRVEKRIGEIRPDGKKTGRAPGKKRIPIKKQLLKNPGCEALSTSEDLPYWTSTNGRWHRGTQKKSGKEPKPRGKYFFAPGARSKMRLEQDVDVGLYAEAIDQGSVDAMFSGWVACYKQKPGDRGHLELEFLDLDDQPVAGGGLTESEYSLTWKAISIRTLVPKGTRTIRVSLHAKRGRGRNQKNNNAYFDDLLLTFLWAKRSR